MIKGVGIVGMLGVAFWLTVNGWKLYKAGGFRKVAAFVQNVSGRVVKARKALKARL